MEEGICRKVKKQVGRKRLESKKESKEGKDKRKDAEKGGKEDVGGSGASSEW